MKLEKTDTTATVSEAKVTCVIELPSNIYEKLLTLSVCNGKSINETVRFLVEEGCK